MKPIHIFKTGTHTDSSGKTLTFSEADLTNAVNAYNPSIHQAPIVVGHPKTDAPAFGWVQSLSANNGNLFATPEQVNAQFSEQVRAGSYKKVSASFYPPNSPANPVKGVYYLRHVGFLGAEPPAIKGLQPIEFNEGDGAVTLTLDFSEPQAKLPSKKSIFDGMVNTLYSLLFGEGDTTPINTEQTTTPNNQPLTSQPNPQPEQKDNIMSETETSNANPNSHLGNDNADIAKKDAEIAQLKQQLAEKEKAEAQAKIDAEQKANSDFAEGLVNEGKLAPAQKPMVVAMLNAIDTANRVEPVNFGEGDNVKPLSQAVKDSLANAQNYNHLFSESAGKDKQPATAHLEFGENVDSERLALHQKILAYAEKNNVDYTTASIAVVNQ